MAEALPCRPLKKYQLAAPGAAILPHPVSVERDAKDRLAYPVFSRNRRNMCDMMLDANEREVGFFRVARREEIRMQIAGGCFRRDVEDRGEVTDRLLEKAIALGVVEVADMLRDEGLPSACHRHSRLEMPADRDDAWAVRTKIDGFGHESARAPQERRRMVDHRHHGIIRARDDGAIMPDDEIGDALQTALRVGVVNDQRFAARIGAGRDKNEILRRLAPVVVLRRARRHVKEQMMQRSIREHDADATQPGRDGRRESANFDSTRTMGLLR